MLHIFGTKVHQLHLPTNPCNPDQDYNFRFCIKVKVDESLTYPFVSTWILLGLKNGEKYPDVLLDLGIINHKILEIQENVSRQLGCRTKWDRWVLDQDLPFCSTLQQFRWKFLSFFYHSKLN